MNPPLLKPFEREEYLKQWCESVALFQQLTIILKPSIYTKKLDKVINHIKGDRKIVVTTFVNPASTPPSIWGPIYWKFLHLTSILLQDELSKLNPATKQVKLSSLRAQINFAVLIATFDEVLICGICSQHYKQFKIKYPERLDFLMKMLSTGHLIFATFMFHNFISDHNDKPQLKSIEFAKLYNIFPFPETRSMVNTLFDLPIYQFTDVKYLDKIETVATKYSVSVLEVIGKIYESMGLKYIPLILGSQKAVTFASISADTIVSELTD